MICSDGDSKACSVGLKFCIIPVGACANKLGFMLGVLSCGTLVVTGVKFKSKLIGAGKFSGTVVLLLSPKSYFIEFSTSSK